MKNKSLTKYLLLSVITLGVGFSQPATIRGIVKDSGNKDPLVGANVYITGTSQGTASSDAGKYMISNVDPGTYMLKASYIGYDSKEMEITVLPGENFEQDFELDYAFLSGGERTAVALAYRLALNQILNSLLSKIKTQDLVILDEPTAALDPQTENALIKALLVAAENKLVIVIAHRLSTIRQANMIVFLEDGEILDSGNHETMMKNPVSPYRKFVELQSGKLTR